MLEDLTKEEYLEMRREELREEGIKEGEEIGQEKSRQYFLELLDQDLTKDEIKARLQQEAN